jgi:hypothetical protein
MAQKYVLGENAAAWLQAEMGHGPGMPFDKRRGRDGSRRTAIVKCLSDTAVGGNDAGDQCYEAVPLELISVNDTRDELARVWLTVLTDDGDAGTPTEGAVYHGIISGSFDPDPGGMDTDPLPRVFAVAPPAGSSLDSAEVVSDSVYSIASSAAWVDTGFDITLPSAGTYFVTYQFRAQLAVSAGSGGIHTRLWNETAAADVDNAYLHCVNADSTNTPDMSIPCVLRKRIVVAESTVIRLEAFRVSVGATFVNSQIDMSGTFAGGATTCKGRIDYLKVA